MKIRSIVRSRITTALVSLGAVLTLGIASAQPASAADPQIWNLNGGDYTAMYYVPNTDANIEVWDPNGLRFEEDCWIDNAGHRWFYGTDWNGNIGYITAGNIINQVDVGAC